MNNSYLSHRIINSFPRILKWITKYSQNTDYNSKQYMIFQHGLELVLIQWILIGYEAILETKLLQLYIKNTGWKVWILLVQTNNLDLIKVSKVLGQWLRDVVASIIYSPMHPPLPSCTLKTIFVTKLDFYIMFGHFYFREKLFIIRCDK